MISKRILLAVLAVFILAAGAYAQGDYLEMGQNGGQLALYVLASQPTSNNSAFGGGISAGLVYYGVCEGQLSLSINQFEYSGTAAILATSVMVYPMKQNWGGIPISAAFGLSCQLFRYTTGGVNLDELSCSFGAWLLRNFEVNRTFIIQPNIGLSTIQQSEGRHGEMNFFDMGLSFFFKSLKKNRALRFDFTFSSSEYANNYGFQLGYIFESHKIEKDKDEDKVDQEWD